MCGFVFIYAKGKGGLPNLGTLSHMDEVIRHRGPDEHGQQAVGPAMMAHRRLRIIDLDGGQQPMVSPDGKIWIVFNGEIYNYTQFAENYSEMTFDKSGPASIMHLRFRSGGGLVISTRNVQPLTPQNESTALHLLERPAGPPAGRSLV